MHSMWKGKSISHCDLIGEISENAPDDVEGFDAAAAHIANLLSTEPADSRFLVAVIVGGAVGHIHLICIAFI